MSKKQHVYALFESSEAAAEAYAAVRAGGCSTEHCSAILHENHLEESALTTGERASREGAIGGAAIGGTAGVLLGGLAVLGGGLIGVGPLAAAVIGGGFLAAYGAVLGGISGSDEPEKHLRGLQEEIERGKVLIVVETDDVELGKMCEMVFAARGGHPIVF